MRTTIAIGNMNVCLNGRKSSAIGSLIEAHVANVADHADDLHRFILAGAAAHRDEHAADGRRRFLEIPAREASR